MRWRPSIPDVSTGLLVAVFAMVGGTAHGATILWSGGCSSKSLTDAACWAGGRLPGAEDTVQFEADEELTVYANSSSLPTMTVQGLTMFTDVRLIATPSAFRFELIDSLQLGGALTLQTAPEGELRLQVGGELVATSFIHAMLQVGSDTSVHAGSLYLGQPNGLVVEKGGLLSTSTANLHSLQDTELDLTRVEGTWTNTGLLCVGRARKPCLDREPFDLGPSALRIQDGGRVDTDSLVIGGSDSVEVGFGARLEVGDSLRLDGGRLDLMGAVRTKDLDSQQGVLGFKGGKLTVTGRHTGARDLIVDGRETSGEPTLELDGGWAGVIGDVTAGGSHTGRLEIRNGGRLSNQKAFIGSEAGSHGSVIVDSGTWVNREAVFVGDEGVGTLRIVGDGLATADSVTIGLEPSGNGRMTLSGGTWTSDETLGVGAKGQGELRIEDEGEVESGGGFVALESGSRGSVHVEDGLWDNEGSLYVGGGPDGAGGRGDLTVADGGRVWVEGSTKVWAPGTVTLSGGALSTIDFDSPAGAFEFESGFLAVSGSYNDGETSLDLDGDDPTLRLAGGSTTVAVLVAGGSRSGKLEIRNGGTLSTENGFVGRDGGSHGTVVVADSSWANQDTLHVGESGIGELAIQDDGKVSTVKAVIGAQSGGSGNVTVTDGVWVQGENLQIGRSGQGRLNIARRGVVSSYGSTVGVSAGGDGGVAVDGGVWKNRAHLTVGHGGAGSLSVVNGGMVSSTTSILGSGGAGVGEVRIADGSWDAGELVLGNSAQGLLTIEGDGSVSGTKAIVGLQPKGVGSATVSGGQWRHGDELVVGMNGRAAVEIRDGGKVENGAGTIAVRAGSRGSVKVAEGTWTNRGSLTVGNSGLGTLEIGEGGAVSNTSAVIGTTTSGRGDVTVSGGTWKSEGMLELRKGSLTVRAGGTVMSERGWIGLARVEVFGGGSWILSGGLSIRSGLGILRGGTVSNALASIDRGGRAVVHGGVWHTRDQLRVGRDGSGQLWVENDGFLSSVSARIDGNAHVDEGVWRNEGPLLIGVSGKAFLRIGAGGTVSAATSSIAAGAEGAVVVRGVWEHTGELLVGSDGEGSLSIEDGGTVSNTNGFVGFGRHSMRGTVFVESKDGFGTSTWQSAGSVHLGGGPDSPGHGGFLIVRAGGRVEVAEELVTGSAGIAFLDAGTLHVGTARFGADAFRWTSGRYGAGTHHGPLANTGDATVLWLGATPRSMQIQGDYVQGAGGGMSLKLAGTTKASEYDTVRVAGASHLGGRLEVELVGDFIPEEGAQFDLFETASLEGEFEETELPELGEGLRWDLRYESEGDAVMVRLSVVADPEVLGERPHRRGSP